MATKNINRNIESEQFQYLAASFKIWLETLGYKPHTIKLNDWGVQEFLAFLEVQNTKQLKDFKGQQLNEYLGYLQHRPNCIKGGSLSAGYINKHITALRLFSKYLLASGKAGITIKPDLLKTTDTATYLTKNEVQDLYKAAKQETNIYRQRDTAMLDIFYGCGLRAGEGISLNTSDLLFKKNLLYVRKGKGNRERYVPIDKQVKSDLQEYIFNQRKELLSDKKSEALLLGRRGHHWTTSGMYHRLEWLKKQTADEKLKQKTFGLHILRHSIATHLLQSGMKLEQISRFLGHKSLETTQKYTHLANENNF